jgi:hypothetical protein
MAQETGRPLSARVIRVAQTTRRDFHDATLQGLHWIVFLSLRVTIAWNNADIRSAFELGGPPVDLVLFPTSPVDYALFSLAAAEI